MKSLVLSLFTISSLFCTVHAQSKNTQTKAEQEIESFFEKYAEHLRQSQRGAIASLYDTSGCYMLGSGHKEFVSFQDNKDYYLTKWNAPKSFDWKDISIEVISPTAAVVTAIFIWERSTGEKRTSSYTGFLINQSGQWRIRVEDKSFNTSGFTTKIISGSSSVAGPYKYLFTAQAGSSISAHLHSADMHIKVVSGRKFIIMGDLDESKVQRFEAGTSFVIPRDTWHVEWWEEETVEEIEMLAPVQTKRATPETPRKTN